MTSAVPNGSVAGIAAAPVVPEEILQRLGDPQVAASLAGLLDRLDVIVMLVESLDGLLRHSETILDSAVGSANDLRTTVEATSGGTSVDIGATLAAASMLAATLPDAAPALVRGVESGAIDELTSPELVGLLKLLGDPAVGVALTHLVEHLDLVVMLVDALDGLLRRSETILDSVVASAGELRTTVDGLPAAAGVVPGLGDIDVRESAAAATGLFGALPDMAPALIRGAQSGAIDALTSPALVHVLKLAAAGVDDGLSDSDPIEVKGALSLGRILKDPDVARALGFFATLTRSIGRRLPDEPLVRQ